MVTARSLAAVLSRTLVEVAESGVSRTVTHVELVDPALQAPVETTDLAVAIGLATPQQTMELVPRVAHSAGLVVRAELIDPRVIAECRSAGLTLLGVTRGTSWSPVVSLLRRGIEAAGSGDDGQGGDGGLFAIADRISAIIKAPITIEDPHSQVLAYSTGQHDIDAARQSTIIGRRVPREVRDYFRSLGVFRRIASSNEPIYVPEGPHGVKPRFVVPVRVGGEWLGSIWAVVDGPVPEIVGVELSTVAQELAVRLLRARGYVELNLQLHAEQVRALLREAVPVRPEFLPEGPWRVVALSGPGADSAETRRALWAALSRRHGWRQPLLTELGDVTYAIATDTSDQPGSWRWLSEAVATESARDPSVWATAGGRVAAVANLPTSAAHAHEQLMLGRARLPASATTAEDCWTAITLARAGRALGDDQRPSPLDALRDHDVRHQTVYIETLAATLGHWGRQKQAAHALGVHPNSVRLRMARITDLLGVDLEEARTRLALQLLLLRP